jgi:hypothetical protein
MNTAAAPTPDQPSTAATLIEGSKLVGRAVVHGVLAALALSALTFAIAQRAHAKDVNALPAPQLAPVNAELTDLYVAAGGAFHRAALVKSHTEVWVDGTSAQFRSTRVFDVAQAGEVTLVAPLAAQGTMEHISIDSATSRFRASGYRNDAGYDEAMLADSRGGTRLTYAAGAVLPGVVVVEMLWRHPMEENQHALRVPIKNSRESVALLAQTDADLDLGCGDAPEPMTWSVRVTPDWQVDLSPLANTIDHEKSAESSWVWSVGNLQDAPTYVALNLQRRKSDVPTPAQKPATQLAAR